MDKVKRFELLEGLLSSLHGNLKRNLDSFLDLEKMDDKMFFLSLAELLADLSSEMINHSVDIANSEMGSLMDEVGSSVGIQFPHMMSQSDIEIKELERMFRL